MTPTSDARGAACGCCAGLEITTPAAIENRAGLSAVAYRIGTQPQWKASLLARLSSSEHPALAELLTRDDDDFTIALLDAWACVADVLAFYQERIANEAYLRTATERLSVLELARLIGYRPRPGVAAETALAFTVEDPTAAAPRAKPPGMDERALRALTGAASAPPKVMLPVGLQVQSVPGQDEKPQTFETVQAIEARAAWNALEPRARAAHVPGRGSADAYLAGVDANLKAGDALLFVGSEREQDDADEHWDLRLLTAVEIDVDRQLTHVTWEKGLGSVAPFAAPAAAPKVYVFRRRASIYGHNAPKWVAMPDEFKKNYPKGTSGVGAFGTLEELTEPRVGIVGAAIVEVSSAEEEWPGFRISTVAGHADLDQVVQQVVPGSWVVLSTPSYRELYRVASVAETSRSEFALSGKVSRLELRGENLDEKFAAAVREITVFAVSDELRLAERPREDAVTGESIELETAVDGLEPGRLLAVTGSAIDSGGSDAGASGGRNGNASGGSASNGSASGSNASNGNANGGAGGELAEIVTLARVEPQGERSRLVLEPPGLVGRYRRASVRINANVAPANHGETVRQILGSGNAAEPHQRFELRHAPLTWVSADNASGADAALELYVNDVRWQRAETLFARGGDERLYTVRTDDGGKSLVELGDGHRGARLPTGQNNVRATYRKGIGLAGNVAAGTLTTLLTRPLGVKAVDNPRPAAGGDDPEPLADARANAPLTVLTLERVVSLLDYENFARAFSGIAKAHAVWLPEHGARSVFLTIAGPNGAAVSESDKTYTSLLDALHKAGDPFVRVSLASYRPAAFRLAAKIKRDPAHDAAKVDAAVESALRDAFSFERRGFGEPVHLSAVVAVMQSVAGVLAVDVDALYRGAARKRHTRLDADQPHVDAQGRTRAAELLTLAEGPLDYLEEMP